MDLCDVNDDGGAVHRCLHAIMHLIEDHAKAARIPVRFAASKLAEGDPLIMSSLNLDTNEKKCWNISSSRWKQNVDLTVQRRSAHIAYFDFIEKICDSSVIKPRESKEHLRSVKWIRSLLENTQQSPALPVSWGLYFTLPLVSSDHFYQTY